MHEFTVIVECQTSGPIPGYQVQLVTEDDSIGKILQNYCNYKVCTAENVKSVLIPRQKPRTTLVAD
jgi:hypothetical protein